MVSSPSLSHRKLCFATKRTPEQYKIYEIKSLYAIFNEYIFALDLNGDICKQQEKFQIIEQGQPVYRSQALLGKRNSTNTKKTNPPLLFSLPASNLWDFGCCCCCCC